MGRDGGTLSWGTGEQVVVLGEDSGTSSGIGQNIMSVNGVRETDHLRVVK